MRSIVLAGGSGTRLRGALGTVKLLAKVDGASLLCYPLRSMANAGVSHALIAAPRGHLHPLVDEARSCNAVPLVEGVETPRSWAGSGFTLLDALGSTIQEWPLVVSVGDHVFEPCVVEKLVEGCSSLFCVAGDRMPRLVDPAEATKILVRSGALVSDIGKSLGRFDYVDVGVHLLRAPPPVDGLLGPFLSLNDVKRKASAMGLLEVVDVTGCLWIDVDTPGDLERLVSGPGRLLLDRVR